MRQENDRAGTLARDRLARTRDNDGRFLKTGERRSPRTVANRKALKERDYLRSIVAEVGREDVVAVARAIVDDAKGKDDADVKVVNAAREWIGKYLLGNARVPLDDCDDMPAIV